MTTRRVLRPPAGVPFRRVEGLAEDVSRLQRATEESSRASRNDQRARSVSVRVEMPASGDVKVPHRLGRKPQNVEQKKVTGAAPSYFETARTTRFLAFTSASACVVEFEVS